MLMRMYWKKLGGHVHVRVFSGDPGAKNGDLCFREDEWPRAHTQLATIAEVVPDDPPTRIRERIGLSENLIVTNQ